MQAYPIIIGETGDSSSGGATAPFMAVVATLGRSKRYLGPVLELEMRGARRLTI